MPDVTSARRNSAIWLGLLLILLAIFSNALYFFHLPARALPWLNVALPILAFVVLMVGVVRAFRQPHLYRGKIWGTILTVLSLLICVASVLFFMVARSVPGSAGAPQIGQRVPDFTLPDSTGQPVSLSQLFSATPGATPPKAVLLVFYRGYWWPFCNLELRGIQEQLTEFTAQGIRPVAISVDPPAISENLRKKQGYAFTFLSDSTTEVIRHYDLLHHAAGPESSDISRPAEFLVDRSGTVRWENFTEDIRVRPRAQQLLAAARSIPWRRCSGGSSEPCFRLPDQLRQIATEIDEEYASEPEPIVRPWCLVAPARVQVIMRTLPSVSQMVAQVLRGLHRGNQANSTA